MSAERGIEVEGLVREFKGGIRAVAGIDLYVEPGRIYISAMPTERGLEPASTWRPRARRSAR